MPQRTPLPRETAVDILCDYINGLGVPAPHRRGYMSRERAHAVLDMWKNALHRPISAPDAPDTMAMHKTVSVSTGLTYFDLTAPALNMFPTVTPIRNMMRRFPQLYAGDKFNYEVVLSTTGSGLPTMGWVPEGQRAASMSYNTTRTNAVYATFGEEDSVTEEALIASDGFEDEAALVQLRSMLRLFVKEEMGLLGGDLSLALGTPTTPTVTVAAFTGASLTAGTFQVIVVGLTAEGYQNASVANGVTQSLTITGNDGQTYTLNAGSSARSASTLGTVAGTGTALLATIPVMSGAAAYAWYAGPSGTVTSAVLQTITTINSVAFTAPLTTGTQVATAITADCSTNSTAFDGLLNTAFKKTAQGSYVNSLATGTPGTGTSLAAGSDGSPSQIDTMFESMWNTGFVSPTVVYANASGIKALANLSLTTATTPLMRYYNTTDQAAPDFRVTTAGVVAWLFNPYTPDGGMKVAARAHPFVVPGTFLAWTELLPPWYMTNALPSPAVVATRQDYYIEIWPRITRKQFFGVYSQESLAVYAPFGLGVITNVAGA